MTVFLFDIDGTLLLTGGAGRVAMQQAMRDVYQLTDLPQLDVLGRTDFAIIRDLFEAHNLEHTTESHAAFCHVYHQYLAASITECEGQLMPGVVQLLQRLRGHDDVSIGLLTGNCQAAADIKLTHFELHGYFEFGGFGDWHAERDAVAEFAYEQCVEFHGKHVPPKDVWVIGDTIHDIRCARSIGARVIAVATGGMSFQQLAAEKPDLALANLTDQELFLQTVTTR